MPLIIPPNLSVFSLATVKLTMSITRYDTKLEETLGFGSGFLWRRTNKIFCVTCLHNLTGLNIFTKKPMLKSGAVPDKVFIEIRYLENGKKGKLCYRKYSIPLSCNGINEKTWESHPTFKDNIDVAIIELPITDRELASFTCINDSLAQDKCMLEVGQEIRIPGFPEMSDLKYPLAIWKQGIIALDPWTSNQGGTPVFIVDAGTKKGFSGSPALLWLPMLALSKSGMGIGRHIDLLGIYGGRCSEQDIMNLPEAASSELLRSTLYYQVGFVWSFELLKGWCD